MSSKNRSVQSIAETSIAATGMAIGVVAEEFPLEGVINGAPTPTRSECQALDNGIWVEVDGKGDCLRYWSAGLTNDTPSAVFYIHGDRIWAGKTCSYSDNNRTAQKENAISTAESIGMAYVKIGRPGLYGSSGAHSERRQMREMRLIEGAVREIIKRFGIKHYGFTGQSGGGSVVAYLFTQFPDAKCVTFTSSALSLEGLKKAGQTNGYDYGALGIYDPIKHLPEISPVPDRRIFVIGDEQDEYALFSNQIEYYEAAKAAGHDVILIPAEGDGHHKLDATGQHVTAWCLKDLSTEQIKKKIADKEVKY
ncbi:MAG TPA: hypothetical protein VM532_06695 [Burkholderiales bacterium]|nr:hypothetical protein [Burkholderiales bacterium]